MTDAGAPVLSIVVPTKDRYDTLTVLTDYLMSWSSQDFELVISDNSDDPSVFADVIERHASDPRFKYTHFDEKLDLIGNSSKALQGASGEYVCFLGDDDGLVPLTVDVCRWLNSRDIDSATFDRGHYTWPDLMKPNDSGDGVGGLLRLPMPRATSQSIDTKAELTRFLRAGLTNYHYRGPFPYNGLLRRSIYEHVLEITGSYFPAPTPDVSCAVSASLLCKSHVHMSIPVICGGHSYKSAAGLGRRGAHVGEVKDIRSLPPGTDENWTEELPHFWSGFTINAESALKTLLAMDRGDLFRIFNFNRNAGACLVYLGPKYRRRVLDHAARSSAARRAGMSRFGVYASLPGIYWARAIGLIRRKRALPEVTHHLTIADALTHIEKAIERTCPDILEGGDLNLRA